MDRSKYSLHQCRPGVRTSPCLPVTSDSLPTKHRGLVLATFPSCSTTSQGQMGNPGGGLGSASAVFMGLGLSSGGSSRLRRGEWQGLDERLPLPWALEFKSQLHRFLPGGHGLVTSASRRFPSVKQGDDIDRRFAVGVRAAQRRLCSVKVNQAETSEVRRRAAGTPSHATLLTDTAPPPRCLRRRPSVCLCG